MEAIIMIGRIIFSLMFIASGVGHLAQTADSAAYAESKGLSNATLMVQVSGVALLLGGLGVITGFWIDLALLGLAALLLIMAVTMHAFWKLDGPEQQNEMAMFMKNLTLAGACIVMFGFFAYGWDATTIVGPALDLR